MDFQPPSDLEPFEILFDHSEANPTLPPTLVQFAGSLGFPEAPADRPWVYANFVQSLDGLVSFGGTRPGGEWVGRSRHDRWMMDLLRAHANAILLGARSLVLEALHGKIAGGPVFRIVEPELLRLRHEALGRQKLKNIIVSGSGNLNPEEYRLFRSEQVEGWIATTVEGAERLKDSGFSRVLACGRGGSLDLRELLQTLRTRHGVEYLLCEGGPTLYGHMARGGHIDEKFLTIAPQEIGAGIPPEQELTEMEKKAGTTQRPTTFAGPGFNVENALWYRWISCRKAGEHEFNRYRVRRP
ncbi:MAG: dihydrofolate reductase family protein [Acidobacteria bacterium]|nr:dihydrofolate reductase family protein [Acidobacteriota bacterium]